VTEPIHVLTPHCGLRNGSQLGGEVYERHLLRRLPQYGVIPHVGLPASRPLETAPPRWKVDVLRPGRGLRWYVAPAAFFPYALRELRNERIDLVRVHAPRFVGPSVLAARRAARLPHMPIVAHHHHGETGPAGAVDRWVLRRASLVIVPSAVVKAELGTAGVAAERVIVIPNGVELASPRSDELAWRGPPGARLLFMSRLIPRKRPLLAIESVAALAAEFPKVELVVVGRGPLTEAARRHALKLGVEDRVQFVPWVSDEAKAWLMTTADVFLMPSTLEGFGLVALESQLAGTPVVGGPASSLREVMLPGETGLLVGPEPAAFVKAIRSLLGNPGRRVVFGEAGRRHASAFSWDAAASATADAYRQALAEAGT
jgi:glycosyltransferase involved in cell wall biosynthesis